MTGAAVAAAAATHADMYNEVYRREKVRDFCGRGGKRERRTTGNERVGERERGEILFMLAFRWNIMSREREGAPVEAAGKKRETDGRRESVYTKWTLQERLGFSLSHSLSLCT